MTMCITWDEYVLFLEDAEMAVSIVNCLADLRKSGKAGYYSVDVDFGSGRIYTYLASRQYIAGQKVVVPTPDGNKVVKVVKTEIRTRRELEKKCPFDRYKMVIREATSAYTDPVPNDLDGVF